MPHLISLTQELTRSDSQARRIIATGPGWKLLLLDLRQGGELPAHSAPGPITVHCVEGQADFAIEGQWVTLRAGDIQTVEAHTRHAVKAAPAAVLLVHLMSESETGRLPDVRKQVE